MPDPKLSPGATPSMVAAALAAEERKVAERTISAKAEGFSTDVETLSFSVTDVLAHHMPNSVHGWDDLSEDDQRRFAEGYAFEVFHRQHGEYPQWVDVCLPEMNRKLARTPAILIAEALNWPPTGPGQDVFRQFVDEARALAPNKYPQGDPFAMLLARLLRLDDDGLSSAEWTQWLLDAGKVHSGATVELVQEGKQSYLVAVLGHSKGVLAQCFANDEAQANRAVEALFLDLIGETGSARCIDTGAADGGWAMQPLDKPLVLDRKLVEPHADALVDPEFRQQMQGLKNITAAISGDESSPVIFSTDRKLDHATYVRIAHMDQNEISELLADVGVDTDGVSCDQLRDTLTCKVEAGEIELSEQASQDCGPEMPNEFPTEQDAVKCRNALSDLVAVLLRADKEGAIWQALYNEGITDAYDLSLSEAVTALGDDGIADVAHRYGLDADYIRAKVEGHASSDIASPSM